MGFQVLQPGEGPPQWAWCGGGHNAHIMWGQAGEPGRSKTWELSPRQRARGPGLSSLWKFEKSCHFWLLCWGMNARAQQGAC